MTRGLSLDVTTVDPDDGEAWDFSRKEKRDKVRKILKYGRQFLVIGSPECKAFSALKNFNKQKGEEKYTRLLIQAKTHNALCCELYTEQVRRGLYFLHEHPVGAGSWKLPDLTECHNCRA